MEKYLKDKKASLILVCVCFITYSAISFTRSAYTAAIAGIIKDNVFSKTDAGLINSSFYITYSLAQIVGSYFLDKTSPFKIILMGLFGTIVTNIAMALFPSFEVVFIARSLCGVFQFGVWPAFLKIVTEYISNDYKRQSMYIMPLGIQVGTVLSYCIAAVVLDYGKWQDLFTVSYLLVSISTIVFWITAKSCNKKALKVEKVTEDESYSPVKKKGKNDVGTVKLIFISGGAFILIGAFAKSMVTFGINSWMPTMIMESYSISPGFSSILTMVSTCSNFVSVFWVFILYPKIFKDQATATSMFFLFTVPLLVGLMFIGQISLALVIVLIIFVSMFTNSIHQFYTVETPAAYSKYNKAGMMAGIFNAAGCLGSVIAGTAFGYVAQEYGWSTTVGLWACLAVAGLIASLLSIPWWKKFIK